jgi:hypothetical protein
VNLVKHTGAARAEAEAWQRQSKPDTVIV